MVLPCCFANQKPMNLLFPFSVTGSTIAALLLFQAAASTAGDEFAQTGFILLTTIMVLAILEHWFLVMPISATSLWNGLWQWSLASRGERGRPQPTARRR